MGYGLWVMVLCTTGILSGRVQPGIRIFSNLRLLPSVPSFFLLNDFIAPVGSDGLIGDDENYEENEEIEKEVRDFKCHLLLFKSCNTWFKED